MPRALLDRPAARSVATSFSARCGRGLMAFVLCAGLWSSNEGCIKTDWKEGIACGKEQSCPHEWLCCDGRCYKTCAARDATPESVPDAPSTEVASDLAPEGPPIVVCPVQTGGCLACMPGCPCVCAGVAGTCCLKLGVATCTACP